ncbi:MAG: hypothetical protein QOE40_1585 [Actinomycetota bacterium]|nr:hypothetical protein [Actinomycetota bacterium]
MSTTTPPPRGHPVLGALQTVAVGLDELADANLWSLSDAEMLDVRMQLQGLSSRLTSATLRATRELDVRDAAVSVGAATLVAWLVNVLRVHPGEAGREVRLAAALDHRLPATAAALADGHITSAAVTVIADTDRALATTATAVERAQAEALLVEHAQQLNVRGLQAAALHVQHRLDPERGERMAQEEEVQVARRELRLIQQPDGSARVAGHLDKEAATLLRTGLDPLAKPKAQEGARDRRSAAQRSADALVELVELALRSGELPQQSGQPVQLVVAIDLADLQQRLETTGAGDLDLGLALSAGAVRRLACDAQIIPAILGSRSEPLDVGRAVRTAPPALRRLLELRDGGCAFPGCDRPPRWSQVHHIEHWADGGATSRDNCVLLCGAHHRTVHHHGWEVSIGADRLPDFVPPAWIDPQRRARRNIRARQPARHLPGPRRFSPAATVTPIRRN